MMAGCCRQIRGWPAVVCKLGEETQSWGAVGFSGWTSQCAWTQHRSWRRTQCREMPQTASVGRYRQRISCQWTLLCVRLVGSDSTCFDLLWICRTTRCATSCTTDPQHVVRHKSVSNRRPTTNPHHPNMSRYFAACCTTCRPTSTQQIEVVEFGPSITCTFVLSVRLFHHTVSELEKLLGSGSTISKIIVISNKKAFCQLTCARTLPRHNASLWWTYAFS